MQVTAEAEMADLVQSCLPDLDEIEAASIQDCCLRELQLPLRQFSKRWGLSGKALKEVPKRAPIRLKDVMAKKDISSLADIM